MRTHLARVESVLNARASWDEEGWECDGAADGYALDVEYGTRERALVVWLTAFGRGGWLRLRWDGAGGLTVAEYGHTGHPGLALHLAGADRALCARLLRALGEVYRLD